jgi:hypothetical protein
MTSTLIKERLISLFGGLLVVTLVWLLTVKGII